MQNPRELIAICLGRLQLSFLLKSFFLEVSSLLGLCDMDLPFRQYFSSFIKSKMNVMCGWMTATNTAHILPPVLGSKQVVVFYMLLFLLCICHEKDPLS